MLLLYTWKCCSQCNLGNKKRHFLHDFLAYWGTNPTNNIHDPKLITFFDAIPNIIGKIFTVIEKQIVFTNQSWVFNETLDITSDMVIWKYFPWPIFFIVHFKPSVKLFYRFHYYWDITLNILSSYIWTRKWRTGTCRRSYRTSKKAKSTANCPNISAWWRSEVNHLEIRRNLFDHCPVVVRRLRIAALCVSLHL